jgi:hypothetical protein
MKLKPFEIIQLILFLLIVLLMINLLGETEIEQHAIDDFSQFLVYKRIIKIGFFSVILFLSIIFIEIRQYRMTIKD